MEYASYLAGERWSDHPACTHPLLAELARQVNDFTSDEGRQALIELVPDMIGVTGADLRIELGLALRAARTAVPIVAEECQRIMAVGILTCERLMADLEGCPGRPLSTESINALALAPSAADWASGFTRRLKVSHSAFRRQTAPTIVRYAVQGIAHACVPGRDAVLRDLLEAAIADCKSVASAAPTGRRARGRTTGAVPAVATDRAFSDTTTA